MLPRPDCRRSLKVITIHYAPIRFTLFFPVISSEKTTVSLTLLPEKLLSFRSDGFPRPGNGGICGNRLPHLSLMITIMFMVLFTNTFCIGKLQAFAGPTDELFDELFTDVPITTELYARQEKERQERTLFRSRYVRENLDLLTKSEAVLHGTPQPSSIQKNSIVFNLFDDASFTVVKDRIEVRSGNRYTWYGHIEGMAHSQVILVVEDGSMCGDIRVSGDLYEIRPIGEGIHAIYEIDQSAFPPDGEPIPVH